MSEESKYVIAMQMHEANNLGNALISGIICDGIKSKTNIKINANLKNLRELVEIYRMEIDKILSLLVASCHDVLKAKENSDYQIQIGVAEMLLKKIHEIFKTHVSDDMSKTVLEEEIASLDDQLLIINTMQPEFQKLNRSKNALKEQLEKLNNIQSSLALIIKAIRVNKFKVSSLQNDVMSKSSDIFYYSS